MCKGCVSAKNAAYRAVNKKYFREWWAANGHNYGYTPTGRHRKWYLGNKDAHAACCARRVHAMKQRIPVWADDAAIKKFYSEARRLSDETGIKHHVDHIVPIRGAFVSGLHCEQNLRVIPASENFRKRNKFAVT